ncbi:MAG: hypothetical protein DMF37_04945 [Verrucomicrobia bacterium]|nr:MAG: hypothetical protein DMF37_04945 [Verrucomicrobiota bacterium]
MDNREAKFILGAYRPNGQDAGDPRFSEALEQARRDPILERWFLDSLAFDAAITEKLRATEVPPGLRESILAGVKVSRPLRSPFVKWAIAAALISMAIVGSLIWHEPRKPSGLAGWQNRALDIVSALVRNESSFDAQSHNADELLAWLRVNDAPAAQTLPQELEKLESLGCKTFSWNGIPVSVICFTRPDGGLIHLVATNAVAPIKRTTKGQPELVQQGQWATATWREGDKIYMLAMEGSRDQLRAYLL